MCYAVNGLCIIHCKDIFCSFRRYQVKKLVESCWQDFGQSMKETASGLLCYELPVVMWCMRRGRVKVFRSGVVRSTTRVVLDTSPSLLELREPGACISLCAQGAPMKDIQLICSYCF